MILIPLEQLYTSRDSIRKGREAFLMHRGKTLEPAGLKVTVDLQGCLPKNHSYARRLCYNHRKVYITVKLI